MKNDFDNAIFWIKVSVVNIILALIALIFSIITMLIHLGVIK